MEGNLLAYITEKSGNTTWPPAWLLGTKQCHQKRCFRSLSVGISTSFRPLLQARLRGGCRCCTCGATTRLPHPEEERSTFPGRPAGILALRRMLLKPIPRGSSLGLSSAARAVSHMAANRGRNVPRKLGSCSQEEGSGCGWPAIDVYRFWNCASSLCLRQIINYPLNWRCFRHEPLHSLFIEHSG